MSTIDTTKKLAWQPLESNPDTLNPYLNSLGVPTNFKFVDVYSLEEELLSMVEGKPIAIVVLFSVNTKLASDMDIRKKVEEDTKLTFIKQTISNACGTMAVLHAILNNLDTIKLNEGPLKTFNSTTTTLTSTTQPQDNPKLLSKALEQDQQISKCHHQFSNQGQSTVLEAEADTEYHYATYTYHNGKLVEFDGRRDSPYYVYDCPTSKDLLRQTAKFVNSFVSNEPEKYQGLSILALVDDC